MDDKWNLRFVGLAEHIRLWSKQSRMVGAVLVDNNRRVVSVGYNGPPEDFDDDELTEENSTFVVIHAELNALQNAIGTDLVMFVTSQPCLFCAAAIVASGRVREVVIPSTGSSGRWAISQYEAIKHLEKKKIKVSYNNGR